MMQPETLTLIEVPTTAQIEIPQLHPGDLLDISLFAAIAVYIIRQLQAASNQTRTDSWELLEGLVNSVQITNKQLVEINQRLATSLAHIDERLEVLEGRINDSDR
jgi:hypothetical protein